MTLKKFNHQIPIDRICKEMNSFRIISLEPFHLKVVMLSTVNTKDDPIRSHNMKPTGSNIQLNKTLFIHSL